MLDKCVAELFPTGRASGHEYYIADGSGLPIFAGEVIRVDGEDGENEIPWQIYTYIRFSNHKYPSRV